MAVDVKDLKVGDEVLVRCTVVDLGCNDYRGLRYVRCSNPYGDPGCDSIPVLVTAIAQHIPRKIEVGDTVQRTDLRHPEMPCPGAVRAVVDEWAVVVWTTVPQLVPLSNLERVSS